MAIRLAASGDKAQQLRIFFFSLLSLVLAWCAALVSGASWDGIGERNEIAVDFYWWERQRFY
jgi:hypothetical protein